MRPDASGGRPLQSVRDFLERAARRTRADRALRALAWGPFAILVGRQSIASAARDAAAAVERRDARFRNLLITADEILAGRLQVPGYVAERVGRDAARLTDGIDLRALLPLRGAAAIAVVSTVVWLALAGLVIWGLQRPRLETTRGVDAGGGGVAGAWRVTATIVPPAYTGQKRIEQRDPDRIQALEGSALLLRVDGTAPALRARTPRCARPLKRTHENVQTAALVLSESGYVALEPVDRSGAGGLWRLMAVTVIPDRAPAVQITVPGRDLLLPDARRRIAIAGDAEDDLALARLELRYTTISGSGEQFDFREGSSPIAVTRESAARWRASGELPLASLDLAPGDTVIYRLVASDARGAAGTGASDTYMIDIAAPGQPTLAGFELPPDRDRYGISEQMVLLKIQRLHRRRAALAPQPLREEALGIAAEQRTVRATFTFLLGGEVEDEEEEAAQAHEIEEGRLENAARRDMLEAVRHMMTVETRLAASDTGGAMAAARAAVAALERAFGRRRYFLRTLPVRSRIDPSRRLSGELAEARNSSRPVEPPDEPPESRAARAALAELVDLAARVAKRPALEPGDASRRLARAAERVLALDPSSADLQNASIRLARRAAAVASGDAAASAAVELRAALDIVLVRARRVAPAPLDAPAAAGALMGRWLSALDREAGR